MRRHALSLLAALIALVPASAARAVEPGVVATGYTSAGRTEAANAISLMSAVPSHTGWARIMESWPMLQPNGPQFGDELRNLDDRVNELSAGGVNILLMVTSAPAWSHPGSANTSTPPADPQAYARMLAALAKRYAGKVQAVEVWNEPDDDDHPGDFWAGPPDPEAYTRLLKATYSAVKAIGPQAPLVISGGLVGNHFDYLEGMYAAGAKGAFDAVGVHTDTACLLREPGFYYREDGRVGRYTFTGYREVRATMLAHGDDKPIWMTEFGWSASTDKCDSGIRKGKQAGGVGEAKQAELLTRAYDCLAHDPYIGPAFWFSLHDTGAGGKVISNQYGLINWSGKHRPSFGAFQDVWRRGPDPTFCGGKQDGDLPAVTIKVPPVYYGRLVTTGTAVDATTPIRKIELWGDGRRIKVIRDTTKFRYDWFGSSKLPYTDHTIELRAYDEANNVGVATAVVRRLSPTSARTVTAALRFHARMDTAKRLHISARLGAPADGTFAEHPHGRLVLRMERKGGRRSKVRKGIGTGKVRYVSTPREKGLWRVFAVLDADAPYKRTRTKVFSFRVR